jgi:hypothetical protein
MSGDAMGALIKSKISAIPGISITNSDELQAFCDAVGEGVVEYIQANAVVLPTALISAPPGDPVTGTGTVQ